MKVEDSTLREFYGIPGEEIPYSAYEFDKVRGLADRVRTTLDSGSRNNVHIISGRESLQVRRIAYLTAKNMEESGATIIPVMKPQPGEPPESSKRTDNVFLIDENRLIEDSTEGSPDIAELLGDIIARTHRLAGNGHSILLSLSQDTYEAHFRDHVDGDGTISYREKPAEKSSGKIAPKNEKKKQNLGKYWAGTIFLAASLAISPVLHGTASFSNYTLSGKSGFDADLRELVVLVMAALTIAGLLYMALSSKKLKGVNRAVTVSGISLFSAEAIIPLILYLFGTFPGSPYTAPESGVVITSYFTPYSAGHIFIILQSVAAISFVLVSFPFAERLEKSGLMVAFLISEIFLFAAAGSAVIYASRLSMLPLMPVQVFIMPYNTPVFGLFYNQDYPLSTAVIAAAYVSQWMFAAMYTLIGLKNRSEWWKTKNSEVASLTGKL